MRILFLLLLFVSVAHAGPDGSACSNADVDSLEEICTFRLDSKFSSCVLEFTVGTAVLSDFDIALTLFSGAKTIYTASADYTTPEGFLYYASSDLTTANTSDTHLLLLDNLSNFKSVTFSAAGTNSVFTGRIQCNDI
jgi:hypothetical protein